MTKGVTKYTCQCQFLELNCRQERAYQHLRSWIPYLTLSVRFTLSYQKLSVVIKSHGSLVAQHQASDLNAFQDEAIFLLDDKHCTASLYWFYTLVNLFHSSKSHHQHITPNLVFSWLNIMQLGFTWPATHPEIPIEEGYFHLTGLLLGPNAIHLSLPLSFVAGFNLWEHLSCRQERNNVVVLVILKIIPEPFKGW